MKPTEQDRELREELYGLLKTNPRADTYVIPYRVMDIIVEFITADMERVALEARLDERTMLNFHRAYGKDYQATLEMLEEANDDRIAELKAQQEGR